MFCPNVGQARFFACLRFVQVRRRRRWTVYVHIECAHRFVSGYGERESTVLLYSWALNDMCGLVVELDSRQIGSEMAYLHALVSPKYVSRRTRREYYWSLPVADLFYWYPRRRRSWRRQRQRRRRQQPMMMLIMRERRQQGFSAIHNWTRGYRQNCDSHFARAFYAFTVLVIA